MAYKFTAIPGVGSGATTPAAPGSYPFQAIENIGPLRAPYVNFSNVTVAPTANLAARVPTGSAAEPWWMTGLNMLSSVGRGVTDQFAEWSDLATGKRDFDWTRDIPIANTWRKNYEDAQRQVADWTDGQFTFDDIPGLSSLAKGGRDQRGFDYTLKSMGVDNERALFWGGLAGDIAFDPLTYLTFGGTSAVKAGAKAGAKTAAELAADYGLKVGKGKKAIAALPGQIGEKVFDDVIENSSTMAARLNAQYAEEAARKAIQDAMKSARYKAQNAAFSIDIPFTKVTYQIGTKPRAFTKTSPAIRAQGAKQLEELMGRYGIDPSTTGAEFVGKALGKTNLEEVTFQEYNWLKNELKNFGEFAAKAQKANPFDGAAGATTRQFGTKTISTGADLSQINPLDFYQPSRFVPDMGGRSPVGQAIADKLSALNPRQVGKSTSGALVNNSGNLIQNTLNVIRNNLGTRMPQRTKDILREAESFSPNDKAALNYVLEGEFPKGFDMSSFDATKVYRMAERLSDEFAEMAKAESASGVLSATRQNYAPHIVNKSEEKVAEILQKYADDPELQNLAKVAADNTFDQSRKSFRTFAQLDNYIADLGVKIAAEADPAKIAQLQQKLDDVAGIFERDPFKAFQKRLYKSYRVRELGNLYRALKDDGLLLENPKGAYDAATYVRLTPQEASKLNAPVGSIMHREAKNALIQADKLFNNEGLNKALETYTSALNIWKGLTTTIRPVHHLNNAIGNLFNNGLAGVELSSYKRVTGALNRIMRGKPKQEDLDLLDMAMRNGILGQGHADEYRRIFGNQTAKGIRKAENFVMNNQLTSFMRRWLGDSMDNWSRLAHFDSVYNKTLDEGLAADSVRKFLFNYGEQTGADRGIRMIIPFWTWTKNNIPLQLEQLLKQPRYYQTYLRLQDASYEAQGADRQNQRDFVRDAYFMTPWGTARNPRAPMADLNNLSSPDTLLKFLVNSSSPIIKAPFEQVAGKSFFTGAPINNQWEYGLQQAPILNDFYKMFTGQSSILDVLTGKEVEVNR